MEKSKNSINVDGGFLFCGGWNFSKSVSVGPTFIREMRVLILKVVGSYVKNELKHLQFGNKTFL